MSEKVLVGGVGMIPFAKPGASPSYTDMGADAVRRALAADRPTVVHVRHSPATGEGAAR